MYDKNKGACILWIWSSNYSALAKRNLFFFSYLFPSISFHFVSLFFFVHTFFFTTRKKPRLFLLVLPNKCYFTYKGKAIKRDGIKKRKKLINKSKIEPLFTFFTSLRVSLQRRLSYRYLLSILLYILANSINC